MRHKKLLESLDERVGSRVDVRRYNLSDMISESYKVVYDCDSDSNLRSLAESHLEDVRRNPKDIDRLSRQLSIVKEVVRMHEAGEISDKDLEIATKSKIEGPIKEDTQGLGKYQIVDKEGSVVDEFTAKKDAEDRVAVLYKSNKFKNGELSVVDNRNNESCKYESKKVEKDDDLLEDTNLTEEEVDALTKHLSEIRKARKAKESCKESTTKGRKLVRTSEQLKTATDDSEKDAIKQEIEDTEEEWDRADDHNDSWTAEECQKKIKDLQEVRDFDWDDNLWVVVKDDGTYAGVPCTSEEEARQLAANHEDSVIFRMLTVTDESCSSKDHEINESNSYGSLDLSEFSKKSKDKSFMKTFKRLSDKLHEGTVLTRQESISLYKASNSAMTQLSVELEHNPEFLGTFNESVNILSGDVDSLLESMKKGKAPKESTMKSLAKFYDALLESDSMTREREKYMKDREEFIKKARTEQNAPSDALYDDETGLFKDKSGKIWNAEDKRYDTGLKEAEEEEELDDVDIDTEAGAEDEFVGADEGDISSEEEEEFDREYADARVELHKELVDEHGEDEDSTIQDKIAQDAEEVANLPGITEEQLEELEGESSEEEEESEEESEEDDTSEDEDELDDSVDVGSEEITDDELEQLKKYLKEMRQSKR